MFGYKSMKIITLSILLAFTLLGCSPKPQGFTSSDIESLYSEQTSQLKEYATNFTAYWNGTLRWQTPEDNALFTMPELLIAEVKSHTRQGGARWGSGNFKSRTFYFSETPRVGHSITKTGRGVLNDGSEVEVLQYEAILNEPSTGKERGFIMVFDLSKLKKKSEQPVPGYRRQEAPQPDP